MKKLLIILTLLTSMLSFASEFTCSIQGSDMYDNKFESIDIKNVDLKFGSTIYVIENEVVDVNDLSGFKGPFPWKLNIDQDKYIKDLTLTLSSPLKNSFTCKAFANIDAHIIGCRSDAGVYARCVKK